MPTGKHLDRSRAPACTSLTMWPPGHTLCALRTCNQTDKGTSEFQVGQTQKGVRQSPQAELPSRLCGLRQEVSPL